MTDRETVIPLSVKIGKHIDIDTDLTARTMARVMKKGTDPELLALVIKYLQEEA